MNSLRHAGAEPLRSNTQLEQHEGRSLTMAQAIADNSRQMASRQEAGHHKPLRPAATVDRTVGSPEPLGSRYRSDIAPSLTDRALPDTHPLVLPAIPG